MSEYLKNAEAVAKKHGLKLKTEFLETTGNFFDDGNNQIRDVFKFRLSRNGKQYTGKFGCASIDACSEKAPTMYDVLACITKYEPGTFEDFCSEYGYDTDSRKVEKVYKAVKKEFAGFSRLFPEGIPDNIMEIC